MRIYGLGTEGGGLLSGICGTVGGAFPGSHGKGSGSQPAHGHEICEGLGFGGFREFKYAVLKAASGRGNMEADAKADSRADGSGGAVPPPLVCGYGISEEDEAEEVPGQVIPGRFPIWTMRLNIFHLRKSSKPPG